MKRISVGTGLSRLAYGSVIEAAKEMREKGTFTFARKAANTAEIEGVFLMRQDIHHPGACMSDLITALAPSARTMPESGIVKLFNYGRSREGLIGLWAGEGDTPTPELIRAGASAALDRGQTFYTFQRGIPPLRDALAAYFARLYERAFSAEEFFVTCGGMQAIQMAVQLVVGMAMR